MEEKTQQTMIQCVNIITVTRSNDGLKDGLILPGWKEK